MKKSELIQTAAALSGAGFTTAEIEKLISIAKGLTRLAEARCNRELTQREENRDGRLEKEAKFIVSNRNERIGVGQRVSVDFNGDPRGYSVKLKLPSEKSNSWGGREDGWGLG